MNNGKVVLAVLGGVAVGAVLGILFAPEKGTVTRKKIVSKKDDVLEGIKDKFNEFVETISERFEAAKEETAEMLHNGKAKVEFAEKEARANRA